MTSSPRPRYRPRIRTLLALCLAVGIFFTGYSYWSDYSERAAREAREMLAPPVGSQCKVVLSAADLGIAGMPAKPAETNGLTNYILGRFAAQNDQWLVLEQEDDRQTWIPRERVLFIEVGE